MEENKPWFSKLFKVFIILIVAVASALCIYNYEQQVADRKKVAEVINSMNGLKIETIDTNSILEYGTSSLDSTTLVRVTNRSNPTASSSVTADPIAINTNVVGTVEVAYTAKSKTLSGTDITNSRKYTFTIKDTQAPIIEIDKNSIDVEQGSPYYNEKAIVLSVKDPVDGELPLVDIAPMNSTSGYYIITSNVDLKTVGKYQVVVHAVDRNGNTADKSFSINVIEKTYAAPIQTSRSDFSSNMANNNQ
jgi:hypothetical protein